MFVYNVKTIPVPHHINIEMVDENESENVHSKIIPDTEMVAMSRDTYINVDQSELKQCLKFSIMYFCDKLFLRNMLVSILVKLLYTMNKAHKL